MRTGIPWKYPGWCERRRRKQMGMARTLVLALLHRNHHGCCRRALRFSQKSVQREGKWPNSNCCQTFGESCFECGWPHFLPHTVQIYSLQKKQSKTPSRGTNLGLKARNSMLMMCFRTKLLRPGFLDYLHKKSSMQLVRVGRS